MKTSQVPAGGLHTCLGSQTPRNSPAPRHVTARVMSPSTHSTVSALRMTSFRRSITPPACAATDASSPASRPITHGSRWKRGRLLLRSAGLSPATPTPVSLALEMSCCVMRCHDLHARSAYATSRSGMEMPPDGSSGYRYCLRHAFLIQVRSVSAAGCLPQPLCRAIRVRTSAPARREEAAPRMPLPYPILSRISLSQDLFEELHHNNRTTPRRPGLRFGAATGAASPLVPVNDRWHQPAVALRAHS